MFERIKIHKREKLFFLINVIIPLLIGLFCYCLYDRNTYINEIVFFNKRPFNNNSKVFLFMSNWGCDFLWAYAFTISLYWACRKFQYTLLIVGFFVCVLEFLQLIKIAGIKCGTFDWCDLIVEFVGIAFAIVAAYVFKKAERRVSASGEQQY